MPDDHHAAKPTLSFAKLVATPTDLAWSQAYNAGNLFVCLSLTKKTPDETISLPVVGKDIFNLLQSEFFSLEEKSPEAIKEAIKVSTAKLPDEVSISMTLANFKENALTVFIAGSGKVVMKRSDKVGVLLEKHGEYKGDSTYASGFLENTDTIVVQTGQFAQNLSHETVLSALDLELPNDVVESMSPQVHEQDDGAQAAIVVRFNGPGPVREEAKQTETDEPTLASAAAEVTKVHQAMQEVEEQEPEDQKRKSISFKTPSLPGFARPTLELTHKRKLYLSVAIILFILLGASVLFTLKKQADEQRMAVFNDIYPAALKEFEAAQGIESLNPEGSRESYLSAEAKLKEGEVKIAKGTDEYKKIEELLAKVTTELQEKPEQNTTTLKEASPVANSLIALAKENADAKGFGQDTTKVYMIDATSITAITKSNGSKKEVIQNDKEWSSPQAVVPYQTNVYVLDQKSGVIKYVSSADGYSKSSYFTGTAPKLSQATGMAIDSSIWIVTNDGKILKYTKGEQDTFGLSGLDKPLNKPSKIVTDSSMESVYIMDNGNKRIVKFDKKGRFQKQYAAGVIANAQEFEIDQKNNRILILSGNKIWEFPL